MASDFPCVAPVLPPSPATTATLLADEAFFAFVTRMVDRVSECETVTRSLLPATLFLLASGKKKQKKETPQPREIVAQKNRFSH